VAFWTIEPFGTPWVILTDIGATIVTVAVALTPNAPVAVIVTTGLGGLPVGTVGGAVKVAVSPLAVWTGEMEPQGAEAQVTDQVTPEFVGSLATLAKTGAFALGSIVLGGTWVRLIVMGTATVNEAEALILWSAVANAVSVMVLPIIKGICKGPGTKNSVLPPEAEWRPGGVQFNAPHVAVQSTPRFEGSPRTVAARVKVAPEGTAGGGWVMTTPVTVEMIVTETVDALLWSVAESALTAIELCAGTAIGAV
jgi:hypothetical protein